MNRNERKRLKKIHSEKDFFKSFLKPDKVSFNVSGCSCSFSSISAAEAAVKKLKES